MLARELHDSVAQQLSYLQIRTSRLQAVLDQRQHEAADAMLDDQCVMEIVQFVQGG